MIIYKPWSIGAWRGGGLVAHVWHDVLTLYTEHVRFEIRIQKCVRWQRLSGICQYVRCQCHTRVCAKSPQVQLVTRVTDKCRQWQTTDRHDGSICLSVAWHWQTHDCLVFVSDCHVWHLAYENRNMTVDSVMRGYVVRMIWYSCFHMSYVCLSVGHMSYVRHALDMHELGTFQCVLDRKLWFDRRSNSQRC